MCVRALKKTALCCGAALPIVTALHHLLQRRRRARSMGACCAPPTPTFLSSVGWMTSLPKYQRLQQPLTLHHTMTSTLHFMRRYQPDPERLHKFWHTLQEVWLRLSQTPLATVATIEGKQAVHRGNAASKNLHGREVRWWLLMTHLGIAVLAVCKSAHWPPAFHMEPFLPPLLCAHRAHSTCCTRTTDNYTCTMPDHALSHRHLLHTHH